nr:IS630 family transposase [Methylocystis bryophila]
MARPLSNDLRERAVARIAAGEPIRQIAAALSISPSSVSKWSQRLRTTGSVAPGKMGGHKRRVLSGANADWLRSRMGERPFTLRGLVAELTERGIRVDYHSVWTFVHDEGLSFKKTVFASEQTRADVVRRRRRWKAYQGRIDVRRLVFLDETWIKTNMAPLRGWAPLGSRLKAFAPFGHWKTLTFVAALRHDGIVAPFVLDGPINGTAFQRYVVELLAPALSPGDVVILDNLGSHKGKAVRDAIRAVGARLVFLPPYSPDLNPIEQLFAKLKHFMRKAGERSVETTWRRAGALLDEFKSEEGARYIANAGYVSA